MQRRDFLTRAAAFAGLVASPLAMAELAASERRVFTLLRAVEPTEGAEFLPLAESVAKASEADVYTFEIDDLHLAADRPALALLEIHAMFDQPDGSSVPFVAWRYEDGDIPIRTDQVRFIAGREAVSRFEMHYRLHGEKRVRVETMELARKGDASMAEGHYLIVLPASAGTAIVWTGLRFSGPGSAALTKSGKPDFDHISMRIRAGT